ncbi:MAG: sigma-70 family RNA polymerase sigma factor [Bacteroidia bacterium]|nr:sigma-70 family RNA polymerase sigma factor [Bacteroidia bacterium]
MMLQMMEDKELVRMYLKGNHASFEVLLSRHKRKVFSYIYMLVKDRATAEDIFQDVFIKVIHTLQAGKYNEEGKFLPWVMRISHNLIIDHFRREKKMPGIKTQDEDFDIFKLIRIPEQSAEDKMIREQNVALVRELIKKLPKEQKEVLILRHYADLSFNDIAEQTGVSINTALGRMRYALINLRKLMEKSPLETSEVNIF